MKKRRPKENTYQTKEGGCASVRLELRDHLRGGVTASQKKGEAIVCLKKGGAPIYSQNGYNRCPRERAWEAVFAIRGEPRIRLRVAMQSERGRSLNHLKDTGRDGERSQMKEIQHQPKLGGDEEPHQTVEKKGRPFSFPTRSLTPHSAARKKKKENS